LIPRSNTVWFITGNPASTKRRHAAAEIVQCEATAHAVQYADKPARVFDIDDHGLLRDFKTNLLRRDTGAVEALDHEFQELRVAECLARQIDREAAPFRQSNAATAQRGERGAHDPAIDVSHEPIALGSTQKFRRRDAALNVVVLQPQQHFERGTVFDEFVRRHDRLRQ